MSKEKQIEEITELLWHFPKAFYSNCYDNCEEIAKLLYEEGYRKQSENTVELPCKIGDKVYRLNYLCTAINEATVKAIYYTEDKKYYPKSHLVVQYDLARGRVRINFSEIGRTLFFTREEAEKALKGGAEE